MKNKYLKTIAVLAAFCLISVPVLAATIAIEAGKQKETLILSLPNLKPRKVFTLGSPDRLVIDVPKIMGGNSASLPPSYKGTLIRSVRLGDFDANTSRFVFETAKPVSVVSVREKNKKLVVELAAGTGKSPAVKETTGKSEKSSGLPLIVLDPGHGGVDPGTIGAGGTMEKNLVLDYARMLKAKLLATGRYRVILTRESDRFIMLRKRFAIARKAKADLFISIHADSAPNDDARGLSVYTLSEKASDMEAEALAAQENKSDVLAGIDLSDEREDVADILISLAQRETKNRSATFADFLVVRLDDRVRLLQNPHRFAGFAVLKAPDIPSVLVETGFLSHPKEERLLKTKAHRDAIVAGMVAGIDGYFKQQKVLGE